MWSDAEESERPEHPWFVGLATDQSWSRAVLTGLSHRLAWEARLAHERGVHLPPARGVAVGATAMVLDGRLGHDVPTVHIVSENVVRGGAGVTIESAYRRALFGDRGASDGDIERELADVAARARRRRARTSAWSTSAPQLLRAAGVARVSVQLMGR